MRTIKFLLLVVVVISGCANSINQRTATNYYEAGDVALAQGDLADAKEMFSRALINVRLGNMGAEAESQVLMNLGRTQGNLCEFDEAEKNFIEAISLKSDTYGNKSPLTFSSKIEMGQFAYDIGWYKKSVKYFEQALEVGGEELKKSDPATYYEIFRDYGDALLKSGNSEKAEVIRKELENNFSDLRKGSDYVRYPTECN